jgi:nitrogen regulatory protein PII
MKWRNHNMADKFELVVAIVNQGFGDSVMDAARQCGARGGTILNARGTAREEAESKFGIMIHPDKEVVLILASTKIKDNILHAIYEQVGLDTPGQGIAFTTPVDDVVGLTTKKKLKQLNDEVNKEKEEASQAENK